MDKLKNIEFLRIIFLLSILIMHISGWTSWAVNYDYINWIADAAKNGGKGVDAFFILSGFFLVYTFNNSTSVLDFVKKKIIRLLPVIAFGLLIVIFMSFFHILKFEFSSAVLTLSFMQMITNPDKIANWNYLSITWYVSVLFWVSLFYFCIIKNTEKKWTNLIIGTITVSAYYIALHLHSGSLCTPVLSIGIFNMGFLRGFGGIGIGYLIGEWYKNRNVEEVNSNKILYTVLELAFLTITMLELIILNTAHKYDICIIVYLTILIILFLLKKGYISQFFDKNWCVTFGKYTFSIYVLHELCFEIIKNTNLINVFGKYCLIYTMVTTVLLGIITYYIVEKPSSKYLKKILFKEGINNG